MPQLHESFTSDQVPGRQADPAAAWACRGWARRYSVPATVLRALLAVCSLAAAQSTAAQSTAAQRTAADSVVVIVADDLGYADIGCYGATDIQTPHLDALAERGTRFVNFYANAPECSPTRAALLSGRYQHRIGGLDCAIGVGNEGRYPDAVRLAAQGDLGLPPEFSVLPAQLADAGYRCAMFGKWHLGYQPQHSPLRHGFETYTGPLGGGIDYFFHTEPRGEFLGTVLPGEHMLRKDDQVLRAEGTYITDLIADEAARWIDTLNDDEPFFLYLPYTAPHSPYQGPVDFSDQPMTSEQWNQGSRAVYRKMIEALDASIGRVLDRLAQRKHSERTLVIFLSDNGPAQYGDAGTLRGGKGNVFEGGIRVPCIASRPGWLPAGSTAPHVGISMDLTRSILQRCDAAGDAVFDGVDLLGQAAAGEAPQSRQLFWRIRRGERDRAAVRDGHWKYIRLRDGQDQEEYLFDLRADEREMTNLAGARVEHRDRLRQMLDAWQQEVRPVR